MSKPGENIYKRKDGRYEGRYVTGRWAGRTHFGYVYGRRYGDVKRELLRRRALLLPRDDARPSGITLNRWMQQRHQRMADRLKPSTLDAYRRMYARHIGPVLGQRDVGRITQDDALYLRDILNRKKLAPSSVSGVLRLLSSLMKSAQEEGLIRINPCRKLAMSAQPRQEQRVLDPQEQNELRAAAEGHLPTLLTLYTGLRLGEVCALQWGDVDWRRRTITVRRTAQRIRKPDEELADGSVTALMVGPPKSLRSRRVIPLPDFLLAMLRARLQSARSIYIFSDVPAPAEPRRIQRQFARIVRDAGLFGVHFHTLRHPYVKLKTKLFSPSSQRSIFYIPPK